MSLARGTINEVVFGDGSSVKHSATGADELP